MDSPETPAPGAADSRRDPAKLAEAAQQTNWHVYRMTPTRTGDMPVALNPEAAASHVQNVIDWRINQLPPEVPLPEYIHDKLPGIYNFVAKVAGVDVDSLPELSAADDHDRHGLHIPMLGHAYIAPHATEGLPEHVEKFYQAMTESTAVHEIAHGVANADPGLTHNTVIMTPQTGGTSYDYVMTEAGGLGKTHFYTKEGTPQTGQTLSFLREGWAETLAMRYMAEQELNGELAPNYPFVYTTAEGEQLPIGPKYVVMCEGMWGVTQTSLAAYAMDMLDECLATINPSSRQLFDIMRDMQHVETQIQAQQELAATLNSLQPGLYKELTTLAYTESDMVKGYKIAQELKTLMVP